jgi:hypothetical protein
MGALLPLSGGLRMATPPLTSSSTRPGCLGSCPPRSSLVSSFPHGGPDLLAGVATTPMRGMCAAAGMEGAWMVRCAQNPGRVTS